MDRRRWLRQLAGAVLGRRIPRHDGVLRLDGCWDPILIRRDDVGVPYIDAANEHDAWFALGFCHGQDRGAQLELLVRALRGTLAEVVGIEALPLDRLARHIGFRRFGEHQLAAAEERVKRQIAAYTLGINQGLSRGARRRPHELALLRCRPSPWDPQDVQAYVILLCFALASNWDIELMRLKIIEEDGAEALAALDPPYAAHLPASDPPGAPSGNTFDQLAADLELFAELFGRGASNAWAVGPARTASGRPLLANDPHLSPIAPNWWYLARLRCPEFAAAGATFVGIPAFAPGHNGHAAWGITAAHADNTDLFLEEIGPDGASVRRGDQLVPCEVVEERIAVRGQADVIERVLLTDRGPIISPALSAPPLPHRANAISLAATWLAPRPYTGLLGIHLARTFEECCACFAAGSASSINLIYADAAGHIGWLLGVELPRRKTESAMIPLPAWDDRCGWLDQPLPFEQLPRVLDPPQGFCSSANNQPRPSNGCSGSPFLGVDWLDGYRQLAITTALERRDDWDIAATAALQRDTTSLPWREMREVVLQLGEAGGRDRDTGRALALLASWDGRVASDSIGASVYEVFVAELCQRLVAAKAPRSARWALGQGFTPLLPHSLIMTRRMGHLVQLLRRRPAGFVNSWERLVADALATSIARLRRRRGDDERRWAWGQVRPLRFKHTFGEKRPLDLLFNIGPLDGEGDAHTVCQGAVDLSDPFADQISAPVLRVVIDVGAWDDCRFALAGGQSGNPCSPQYADQLPHWRSAGGIPIAWGEEHVRQRATSATLKLFPRT